MSDLMEKTLEQIKKHVYDYSKIAENIMKAERRQALNEKLAEGDVDDHPHHRARKVDYEIPKTHGNQ